MVSEPAFHDLDAQTALLWEWPESVEALSSAPVGGGFRRTSWLLNVGVSLSYARTDLDAHAGEIATELGLRGAGVVLFTAADVRRVQRAAHEGAIADATVGISKPTWAADRAGGYTPYAPGTINLVVQLPVPLTPAAAVNAVITATEAKTQALSERSIPGTGTASDAVAIVSPTQSDGPAEQFAGSRSEWGSRLAVAVHAAVGAGIDQWRG